MLDRSRSRLVRTFAIVAALSPIACHASRPHDLAPSSVAPGVDERALDANVSPCDDFYQYACGGWITATTIPEDQPAWARSFDVIQEQNEVRMRDILERDARAPSPNEPYAKALGDFYSACVDEEAIERAGTAALEPEFARIDAVSDMPTLAREVARLHLIGVGALFDLGSGQDFADATQVIGIVSQGGLGLPDRDYYLAEDAPKKKVRDEYLHHMERLLVLAGEKPAEAAEHAAKVLTIERALAEASMPKEDRRDPKKTYHRIDRAGLERTTPVFPWKDYFAEIGFSSIQSINVEAPNFMVALNHLLETTPSAPPAVVTPPSPIGSPSSGPSAPPIASAGTPPPAPLGAVPIADLRTYLRVHWLEAAAPRLTARFVDENFRFHRVLTGATKLLPRWKRCVRAADAAMGEALGRPFVGETLGTEGKARVKEMILAIEESMKDRLGQVAWMDNPTRTRAVEKLGLIANKVGYPDVWRNYDGLAIDRSSYLENVARAAAFEARRQLSKIGKPVDRHEWQMSPPAVNAYYDASMNEMVFPAGILQPPFYANAAPNAVNFGGIGMVMGHELSHGFDDEGRQFDGHGNLVDWWTKSSAAEFDARAACVVKQYDAFVPIEGIHVNGRLTLGENIADLGGVKLAYTAFQKTKSQGASRFTPAQEFFLGYAQSWCTKIRPEFLRMRVATNPHSPAQYRVNGPLSNLPEFAEAFQCKAGSPMARPPADRCEVW